MGTVIHYYFGFLYHAYKTLLRIKNFFETTFKTREYVLRISFYLFLKKLFKLLTGMLVYLLVSSLIFYVCSFLKRGVRSGAFSLSGISAFLIHLFITLAKSTAKIFKFCLEVFAEIICYGVNFDIYIFPVKTSSWFTDWKLKPE